MAEGCLLRSVSDTVAHLARLRELHVVERSDWRSEGSSWTAACLKTRMVAYVETDEQVVQKARAEHLMTLLTRLEALEKKRQHAKYAQRNSIATQKRHAQQVTDLKNEIARLQVVQ